MEGEGFFVVNEFWILDTVRVSENTGHPARQLGTRLRSRNESREPRNTDIGRRYLTFGY